MQAYDLDQATPDIMCGRNVFWVEVIDASDCAAWSGRQNVDGNVFQFAPSNRDNTERFEYHEALE